MKHVSLSLFVALICSLGLHAQTIQPIIFDDPSFDIHSAQLSEEQRSFFDYYIHAMERMAAGEEAEKFFIVEHTQTTDSVGPILGDINFNQTTPYNNKCPYLNGGRAVTGCVATAMAMVMKHFNYPAHGTGTFTYTGGDSGAKTVDLANMPFDWSNILPTYDFVSYTATQADAVATLMLACGASLGMNYDKDGSSANTSKVGGLLKNNFGYDKSCAYAEAGNGDIAEASYWGEDAIRPNIAANRPIIFAGYPAVNQSGHCFVIDGYKAVNGVYYYHVNWGWGGHGNNWCLLTSLSPEFDDDNYSGNNVQMVYNIFPAGQGIGDVEADNDVRATKKLENGLLLIERNNHQYTVQGQVVR